MNPNTFSASTIILTILALVAVLLGAYFTTKLISKKMLKSGINQRNTAKPGRKVLGKYVSLLDRAPLDREKSVVVVEFEGNYYLLGVSPQQVKLIDKSPIPAEELLRREAEESEREAQVQNQPQTSFAEIFKQQFTSKFSKGNNRGEKPKDNTSDIDKDTQG